MVYDACGAQTERTFAVNIDDRGGGLQVGEYFRRCGHRRALCLADNDVDMDHARWEGFRQGFGPGAEFWMIPMAKHERLAFYEARLSRPAPTVSNTARTAGSALPENRQRSA